MVPLLWKRVWQLLIKLNIELPYDLAIPHLGVYLKESKTGVQQKLVNECLAALYTIAKKWKQS